MAAVKEKDGDLEAAARLYDLAWKYSFEKDLSIAVKLAYANMKTRKYVEAIEVSRAVLAVDSESRLRKEIFDKARASLRT